MSGVNAWIGVDLDGTLAHYEGWVDIDVIGEPIAPMVERVKRWLAEGHEVRIMTARAAPHPDRSELDISRFHSALKAWCNEHIGQELRATCVKDFGMIELWDDRAVGVEENTGSQLNPSRRGLSGPSSLEASINLAERILATAVLLYGAGRALIKDVRDRHPGEELKCPHMIRLDEALRAV